MLNEAGVPIFPQQILQLTTKILPQPELLGFLELPEIDLCVHSFRAFPLAWVMPKRDFNS